MTLSNYPVSSVLSSPTSYSVFGEDQTALTIADNIPALVGTLVELELLLKPHSIDLESVTNLVRSDLGLTLQAIRTFRSEMAGGDDLWRISDCVVYFGRRLLELVPPLCWAEEDRQSYAEAEAFWKHAKLVATAAETTAAYFRELDVNPEQAYIAGLLHNLKRLPHVLKFAGLRGKLCGTQDWVTDCDLPSFVNDVLEPAHQGRISCGMTNLSRVVWFSRRWIGLCLPWSETCIARKNRFTLPLLQAANLINTAFPGTDIDPVMPFLETLMDSTMNLLEAERPASSSVLQPRGLEFPTVLRSSHGRFSFKDNYCINPCNVNSA